MLQPIVDTDSQLGEFICIPGYHVSFFLRGGQSL